MEGKRTRRMETRRGWPLIATGFGTRVQASVGMLLLVLLALTATSAGAYQLDPEDTSRGRAIERAGIGSPGDFKDYLRIDTPCPLRIKGPGTLTFYVRAHIPPGEDETTCAVSLKGLEGFPTQRWTLDLEASGSSVYADGRPGAPTSGGKVTLAVPTGTHGITVTASAGNGAPVHAVFYYDGPPLDAPGRKAKRPSPWSFDGDITLGTVYDDNVCRYSHDMLNIFQSGLEPHKFAITNKEDVVLNTAVQVEATRRIVRGKRTRLRFRYQRWDYVENAIKDNDEFQLRLRQYVHGSNFMQFTYTYAPDNYIKELGDREPFLSRSTTDYEYFHFYITRNAYDLDYYWRPARWIRLMFLGGHVQRFYNRRFLENDMTEWNAGIEPEARYGRFYFRLRFGYHHVKTRSYDTLGETFDISDDNDGSYETDAYRVRLTYRPKRSPYGPGAWGRGLGVVPGFVRHLASWIDRGLILLKTDNIYFQYDYYRRFYTSKRTLADDPLHVGRFDQQFQPRVVWTSDPLWNRMSLEAGWRYTDKRAKSPAGDIGEDDPSEEKDYIGTRVWLQATRPLW